VAAAQQLAEDPFAVQLCEHEAAVFERATGFDDDDLAGPEFGRHLVAEHTQRERLGAAAGALVRGLRRQRGRRRRAGAGAAHSITSACICEPGTPAAPSSARSVSTKSAGPAM